MIQCYPCHIGFMVIARVLFVPEKGHRFYLSISGAKVKGEKTTFWFKIEKDSSSPPATVMYLFDRCFHIKLR